MKSRPEDLATISDFVFPSLIGAKRFGQISETGVHMAYSECAVFQSLLSTLKPKCSIEVGTETGATLAMIARHSTRAISIDIDPGVKTRLEPQFKNVEFITGSSHDVLPVLLKRLADEGTTPDFIFVDGDHTAAGVHKDLEFILNFQPTNQMVVVMHDTFNPGCRHGILSASWSRNPYCHYVDLDFCPGVLHPDEGVIRQMWGGLGFALFRPEPRQHTLEVKRTHQLTYEAAFQHSVYNRNLKAR
jgi:hypothetical protein